MTLQKEVDGIVSGFRATIMGQIAATRQKKDSVGQVQIFVDAITSHRDRFNQKFETLKAIHPASVEMIDQAKNKVAELAENEIHRVRDAGSVEFAN